MSDAIINPASRRPQVTQADRSPTNLSKLAKVFRKWLYIPDFGGVLAVLGSYAANKLTGDPVWLLLVGPSSAGKTQVLASLSKRPDVHTASTLTEASLLSGTPNKEKAEEARGGLLREIGAYGIILLKDFTSTLSMPHEARRATLAALREIYDGNWTRRLGVDGGTTLSWEGKIGIIAGCTQAIDSHHAVMSAMGERFLLYRMKKADEVKLAMTALDQSNSELEMHQELADVVGELFEGLNGFPEQLSQAHKERISALATLTARCRSSVERDGRTREIVLIPESEAPGRLAKQLSMLLQGMRAIGTSEEHGWIILNRVALDCIPPLRRSVFDVLRSGKMEIETADIADKVSYPLPTTRRALEDLAAHGVLCKRPFRNGSSDYWMVSKWSQSRCAITFTTVPEKSGTHK